ncbi:hypothetical protein FOL47_007486 [Perkinsus chesapeaki]|uniref:Uncharacterized protein n=1 Tax=Perkinsus chesapeaki TaxID=330153 RepID=A0A7J6LK53_PERCH|nr:hypothetical protein FOL47_007486 [Perkinsus chesapeaki]
MASPRTLLIFILNAMVLCANFPFKGRYYCRKYGLWHREWLLFSPGNQAVAIVIRVGKDEKYKGSGYNYVEGNHSLTLEPQIEWSSGDWDPKWWANFVYDTTHDAWNVGASPRWFERC